MQLDFADVLAEPNSAHGFDPLWRLSFILFSQTKLWLYRILSALLVLPLSILWAVIFALATIAYVWVLRPVIKIAEVCFAVIKRVGSCQSKLTVLNVSLPGLGCCPGSHCGAPLYRRGSRLRQLQSQQSRPVCIVLRWLRSPKLTQC